MTPVGEGHNVDIERTLIDEAGVLALLSSPGWKRRRDAAGAGIASIPAPREAREDKPQAPTISMISSRTRAASACPRVAFMTAPTRAPAAWTLPPLIFATMSG